MTKEKKYLVISNFYSVQNKDGYMAFDGISIVSSCWKKDSGYAVLDIEESHSLIMAAGYLKHTSGEGIYFRGQGKIYNEMRPSLYRGIHTANARSNREKNMNAKIYEYKEKCYIFSKFGDYVAEPLLQHYGLQTTWLDIVICP